jgi:predicted enzyme related to lactoylglutathione lyase
MSAASKFVWFEYVSKEASKAQGFFGELFGWTTQTVPMPDGAYTMIAVGKQTIGGYFPPPEGAPQQAGWLSYLSVADVKASAVKVKALGGKIMKEPFKAGDAGTMAVAIDPHGAAFALWQPAKAEERPAPAAGHFVWNELYTQNPEASLVFYRALGGLGEDKKEMPGMGTYHLLTSDGKSIAGVLKPPMAGVPHAWLPYVKVASADATTDKAKRLGATVMVPPTDVPNVGRFAIFTDPQGAALGILQSSD